METIIAAAVTGMLSLIGVVIASLTSGRSIQRRMDINQAVTDTKLAELTREVREHNQFARRMPVVEEQIKVANHRIQDLEEGRK